MFWAQDIVWLERIHPPAASHKAFASTLAGRPAPTLWQASIATQYIENSEYILPAPPQEPVLSLHFADETSSLTCNPTQ